MNTENLVIKITNEKEFENCQIFLFKLGFIWNAGQNYILKIDDSSIHQDFKIERYIIFEDKRFRIVSRGQTTWNKSINDPKKAITFNNISRKNKLEKLI